MMKGLRFERVVPAIVALALLVAGTPPVHAYGGPGSVVTGIGALLAVVAAVVAAVFGFFWFPIKRLYRKIRGAEDDAEEPQDTS